MQKLFTFIISVVLLPFSICSAQYCFDNSIHRLDVGPEIYYLKRKKEGGSYQSGVLYGGRATFERNKVPGIYYALDAYAAYGRINGKTSSGKKLKSKILDSEFQGFLGY